MEKRNPTAGRSRSSTRPRPGTGSHVFMLAGGAVRGAILHGTRMVNEMRANHELGILETLTLGRAYLGVALMAADLKGSDRVVAADQLQRADQGAERRGATPSARCGAISSGCRSRSTGRWRTSTSRPSSGPGCSR
ncbi:MAG: Hsp33 family molecular chaperone HslO [Desulfobacterales bacterium]|nr:Hsp33 family molecular chaperone HslO [Desulfobacterales bacterium]